MPLYYHPNHKSSEHYPTSDSPPLTNLNHIESQLPSHLSTILVTNYYIQLSFSPSLSLFSLCQSVSLSLSLSLSLSFSLIITTHIFLKNLYFQFFSSQWLLVRTCCFVGGPGHPVEYSDQGGPIRSERGGGMGRTLS